MAPLRLQCVPRVGASLGLTLASESLTETYLESTNMKLKNLILLTLTASVSSAFTQITSANELVSGAPIAIHTNRGGFRIPYQYDAQEISRLGAREIRLFVSLDRGVQWRHVQSVQPTAGRFDFQASNDGEYWFSVRTLDGQGNLQPGGNPSPGLIVVVDTQLPKLTIDLRERENRKVELNWNAADPNIAPETLKLEFTQTGQADWQAVGINPQAVGQTSWTLPSSGIVAVRGQVQDKAGNIARSQYQIQIQNRPGVTGGPAAPPPGPVASPFGTANPLGAYGAATPPLGSSGFGHNQSFTSAPIGSPPPGFSNPGAGQGNGILNGGFTQVPSPPAEMGQSGVPFNFGFPNNAQPDATPKFSNVSDRPGYRTVNARRFQVNYRIDDVGPSGVSAVELYITQNDGQKWFKYGVDEDRRSPVEIEVPGDGMYGFAIRVVSGSGQSDPPPQVGQKPEIVVLVDSSPPVVQLFPLRQGQGRESNRILITWQAADQQLADLPIALSYSSELNGPWEPIAGWQPNSGNYVWTVGGNTPPKLYIRLIARDSAGNLAKVDTPQPVLVDLAKPTARIVDIESNQQRGAY